MIIYTPSSMRQLRQLLLTLRNLIWPSEEMKEEAEVLDLR